MHGLTEMTKVEFVVPGRDAPSIRALITAAGATGYTAVSGVSGIGHHGQHSGALLFNDYDTLTMLITVLPVIFLIVPKKRIIGTVGRPISAWCLAPV